LEWWARQDSNLRQHRYERAAKARTASEILGFRCGSLDLGSCDFNRLRPVACPVRAQAELTAAKTMIARAELKVEKPGAMAPIPGMKPGMKM